MIDSDNIDNKLEENIKKVLIEYNNLLKIYRGKLRKKHLIKKVAKNVGLKEAFVKDVIDA